MNKQRIAEIINRESSLVYAQLENWRKVKGPQAWGDCPADPVAARALGKIDAYQQLYRLLAKHGAK